MKVLMRQGQGSLKSNFDYYKQSSNQVKRHDVNTSLFSKTTKFLKK